jgi:SAM-dependent methyltransferase
LSRLIKALLPRRFHDSIRLPALRLVYGGERRFCPCCDSGLRRFRPYGVIPRSEAICPICYSLERHRSLSLYLRWHPELFADGTRFLHIAPEGSVTRLLRRAGDIDYVSIDIEPRDVMLAMDLSRLAFRDCAFDCIYCSHVLEHVPDDRAALAELWRVLRPGASLVLQIPVKGNLTVEDPSLTDAEERVRRFGQPDHVRLYGRDVGDRLAAAGFAVAAVNPARQIMPTEAWRCGLDEENDIFVCRKPEWRTAMPRI